MEIQKIKDEFKDVSFRITLLEKIFFNKLETWLNWLFITNASILVWITSNSEKYKFDVEKIGINLFVYLKTYFIICLIEMALGFIFLGIYKLGNLICEICLYDLKVSIYEIRNMLFGNVIYDDIRHSFKEFRNKFTSLSRCLKFRSKCIFMVFLGFFFFGLGFSNFILLIFYKLYIEF